ncbi:MAG: sulfite exporter TauE/SafE family protein [Bacteroidetes bacterium]|nr:sulfite exporter TauE/SafE family protein [Bacteroidota bacterium]
MLWSGFILGLVGSLHCLGMCGPIVLVLPGSVRERWNFFFGRILYNLGRAITYAVMGLIIGVIGQSIALAGYQQWLGIAAGSLMILSVLLPALGMHRIVSTQQFDRVFASLKSRLGRMLGNSSTSSLFTIGLLNGFLPCGLVYMALAASLAMGSAPGSAAYMFLFGLGTLPVMFAASYASGMITGEVRRKITRLIPAGVVILGLLFILRGLSLGIPFISPDMEMMKKKAAPPQKVEMNMDVKPPCCQGK